MFILSGFGDEISPNLDKQLDVMEKLGMKHLELRSVDGKGVLTLSNDDIKAVKNNLDQRGFALSAIGSPIGKIKITDDFDEHLEAFERALYLADYFDTKYIRIFSYFIPEGKDAEIFRDEVMNRMDKKVKRAEDAGIILLHENERDIYGDTPERCKDILDTINSPNLRAIFDPANFVCVGSEVHPHGYALLEEYIEYLHIKDATYEPVEIKPTGEGDGRIPEVLRELSKKGFNGFASLEPHLAIAGKMSGFSGPEAFEVATNALKKVIAAL